MGAWAWGDRRYWGYGRDYGRADVEAAYHASRVAGLTLFDTAEGYGRGTSERLLGEFLRAPDGAGAQVATKFAPLPWRTGRRKPVADALHASLQRLQRERVELYQIHWPLPLLSDRAWLDGIADAVAEGKVGAVGVSNYGPAKLRRAHETLARRGVPLATDQVAYSLLDRKPERSGLVETCRDLGVTIIAYSPLAQGLLTGKYSSSSRPPGMRGLRYRRMLPRLPSLLGTLVEIGQDHGGKTAAQVALNWLIANDTLPIPGAKTADQASHNAGGVGWRLGDAHLAVLDQLRLQPPDAV